MSLTNPNRVALMKRRHFVPSLSSLEWSKIGDFVVANRNQLEAAQDLAHAHRIICQQGGTKPKESDWLASVLMMMSIHSIRCAGFPVVSSENHTVSVYTKPEKLRKAKAC
jgi:hypothetical protein